MTSNEQIAGGLAQRFRAEHALGESPIKDLFELVHATVGVDVMSLEAPGAEHGLSMIDADTARTVIAVATTPHPMRQRSSIAHELGHVLAGDLDRPGQLVPGERAPEEIRADAFARHLLLPLGAVRRRFPSGPIAVEDLSDLVQEFEVSPWLAAIQLRTAKLLDNDTCEEWRSLSAAYLATRFGWLSQYRSLAGDSSAPRAPQGLMSRAVEGYRSGVLAVGELAAWYGQDAAELEQELGAGDVEEGTVSWDDDWGSDAPLFPDDSDSAS
jgi:Zn-dependent peptidase ImmA (M78 family)